MVQFTEQQKADILNNYMIFHRTPTWKSRTKYCLTSHFLNTYNNFLCLRKSLSF